MRRQAASHVGFPHTSAPVSCLYVYDNDPKRRRVLYKLADRLGLTITTDYAFTTPCKPICSTCSYGSFCPRARVCKQLCVRLLESASVVHSLDHSLDDLLFVGLSPQCVQTFSKRLSIYVARDVADIVIGYLSAPNQTSIEYWGRSSHGAEGDKKERAAFRNFRESVATTASSLIRRTQADVEWLKKKYPHVL